MSLAIVGLGLVSPWARTAEEHAFFLRAGMPGPPRAPLFWGEGDPLKVRVAPWLGTGTPLPERVAALLRTAIADALRPLVAAQAPMPSAMLVCASTARAPAACAAAEEAAGEHGAALRAERVGEDAGVFSALLRAERLLREDPRRVIAVAGVDSFVSLDALRAWAQRAPSPWAKQVPPLSEGAAAMVVMSPRLAQEAQLTALGAVLHVAVAEAPARDDNDDVVDGLALTTLLREAPAPGPFRFAFGPATAGALRTTEWHYATARNAARFERACAMCSIEGEVGRCGAAAGVMDLVWGLSAMRHDTAPLPAEPRQPFLVWAISPGGTRGLAVVSHQASAPSAPPAAAPRPPVLFAADHAPSHRPLRASRERPCLHAPRRLPFAGIRAGASGEAGAPGSPPLDGAAPGEAAAAPGEDDGAGSLGAAPRTRDALPAPELPVVAGRRSLVWMQGEGLAAWPIERFYQRISDACLETIAAVLRSRATYAWSGREAHERRILAQADAAAAAGGDVIGRALAYFHAALDLSGTTRSWAVAFLLGLLDGDDAMRAVLAALEMLAPDALDHGQAVAEALGVSPHPGVHHAMRLFLGSVHPVARAVAIDVLAGRGALGADDVRTHLLDASPAVAAAAARAAARLDVPAAAPLLPHVRSLLRSPHPAVARAAARALLLSGDPSPYELVRASDPFALGLGLFAAEIVVLRGDAGDLELLQRLLSREPASPEHLAIVARFGHPGAWAYLVHHLNDEELAGNAAAALELLFGPRLEPGETGVAAWRGAIAALRPAPDVRLLGGEPWRPRAAAAALRSGALSQAAMQPLLDELGVRARVRCRPRLHLWLADSDADLRLAADEASARDAGYRAGSWSVASM
ncbi:hypothetical protein [Sorangium sp. So ce385]|uniref:hypothetical protein n=1 Tax=Sorangium sp. So ce385 TaxID=3133308 RepID=UPI003F5BF6D5